MRYILYQFQMEIKAWNIINEIIEKDTYLFFFLVAVDGETPADLVPTCSPFS